MSRRYSTWLPVLVLLVATGCRLAEEVSAPDDARPLYRVGTARDLPPFSSVDDHGRARGYAVDLIAAVSEIEDLRLEIRPLPAEELPGALARGEIDLIPHLEPTSSREQLFAFTLPHIEADDALFSRRDTVGLLGAGNLGRRTVIVQADDPAHEYLQDQFPSSRPLLAGSVPEALRLLAAGEGDAAFLPHRTGLQLIRDLKLTNLRLVGPPVQAYDRSFAIATRRDDRELLDRLDQGLSIVTTTDRYVEIYNAWFGALDDDLPLAVLMQRAAWVLVPILFLLTLSVAWTWSLRRTVARRTAELEREVGERIRTEAALRASEGRLQAVLDNAPTAITTKDRHGRYLLANNHFASLVGRAGEGVAGLTDPDLFPAPVAARLSAVDRQVLATGAVLERELVLPAADGERIFYAVCFPLAGDGGEVEAVCAISTDVTERKKAEAALRFTQYTVDHVSDAAFWVRHDGAVFYANEAASQTLGASREQILERPIFDIVEGLERHAWEETWQRLRMRRSSTLEASCRRDDGDLVPAEISASFAEFEGDECLCFSVRDISVRKRAQDALAGSEKKYRGLFDSSIDAIALCDMDGRWVDANPACLKMLDYPIDALRGRTYQDLTPPRWREMERDILSDQVSKEGFSREYEKELIRSDGEIFPVSVRTWLVEDDGGGHPIGYWSLIRDLTDKKRAEDERQRLEAQIQQAQKLESLGVLAGGIAHDFNNLLMGILGNAGLALLELDPSSGVRGRLRDIEQAGRRAAELCKQMLAYSGKGRFVVQPLDLSRLVADMTHLLEVSISKKASLRQEFRPSLPAVEADATQIRQVIMNLITNASDSLGEEEGVITVYTGVRACDEDYLRSTYLAEELVAGEYVYLEVTDSGCGMDPQTLERIFDPFFSTKFAGRGLGLAAALGIVRGHKGALEVESAVGRGTTFRVLFPASGQSALVAQGEEPAKTADLSGEGTILVVDDEEMVLSIARRVLERAGYTVLTARDGQRGFEIFRRHFRDISVVLLDVTMPRMDGEETFAKMKKIRNDVAVVLSSGYNEQHATRHFHESGLAGFIQKPYAPAALLEKIRAATPEPAAATGD